MLPAECHLQCLFRVSGQGLDVFDLLWTPEEKGSKYLSLFGLPQGFPSWELITFSPLFAPLPLTVIRRLSIREMTCSIHGTVPRTIPVGAQSLDKEESLLM